MGKLLGITVDCLSFAIVQVYPAMGHALEGGTQCVCLNGKWFREVLWFL